MSRPWKIVFKDTVPSSNLRELSENEHKHDLNPQGTGPSKTIRKENRQPLEIGKLG